MRSSPSQQEGGRYFLTDQATGREKIIISAAVDEQYISNASLISARKFYNVLDSGLGTNLSANRQNDVKTNEAKRLRT